MTGVQTAQAPRTQHRGPKLIRWDNCNPRELGERLEHPAAGRGHVAWRCYIEACVSGKDQCLLATLEYILANSGDQPLPEVVALEGVVPALSCPVELEHSRQLRQQYGKVGFVGLWRGASTSGEGALKSRDGCIVIKGALFSLAASDDSALVVVLLG